MKSIELFSGAGGLALGVSLAGFHSVAVIEWDNIACATIRENQANAYPMVSGWPLFENDVRHFQWSSIPEDIDLLAGGPPCQPFSLGGKHLAYGDPRDMFPATIDAIRLLRPKSFVIENVRGLMRSSFSTYYQYILLQLEFPDIARREREKWLDHLRRLRSEKASQKNRSASHGYEVTSTLVNAADYGVPQKRERVFIVGFRSDVGARWSFPRPTHGLNELIASQWISEEYWERHHVPRRSRPKMPTKFRSTVPQQIVNKGVTSKKPWVTVRDALVGLPDPRKAEAAEFPNHRFQAGAKAYPGHSGSPLDLPAKTLKAGDHGVPGGENMLIQDNGQVRYFTVRESARLQSFPDGYYFRGSWTESMRQIGNAVPVSLARTVAASVATSLIDAALKEISEPRLRDSV